ncbi:protein AATF-like [Anneissia japonica]|uniref:protein AATF-like n=1 Tax=Anneissia japonica TaxID=1529436 RepID=UPI001425B574|nr:protein AATF-like [Anneissia japonica]
MSKRKSFFADEFAALSNPTPEFKDPEEEEHIYTRAQLDDQYDEDEETEVIAQSSSLRRKNASLLVSTDKKYSGKTVSRKDLQKDSDESTDDTDESINSDSFPASFEVEFTENDDITKPVQKKNTSIHSKADRQKALQMFTEELDDEENDADTGSDEDIDGSDEDIDDSDGDEVASDENENYSDEDEVDSDENEVNSDENEVDSDENEVDSDENEVDSDKDVKSEGKVIFTFYSLLDLQEILLVQNPESKHVIQGGKPQPTADDDDEEIPSDDEEIPSEDEDVQITKENDQEDVSSVEDDGTNVPPSKREKRKLQNYEEIVAKRHKNFHEFKNMTLQKWHDKTKIASGKINSKSFSSFDRSVLKQIDQILVDQDRLLKRTQLKRSVYNVVGKQEHVEDTEEDESNGDVPVVKQNQHLKDYDPEIFDDDDFYHQLLRELIERRTAGTTDPNQLTRQWLEVQKLRSKVRKKVDTKASKGRKIRYEVHQKLVSFMAPDETSSMSDESRTELYKSLFGQRLDHGHR